VTLEPHALLSGVLRETVAYVVERPSRARRARRS